MEEPKYKIGDRVKVRLWSEMANEAVVVNTGRQKFLQKGGYVFVGSMVDYCGKTCSVTDIGDYGGYQLDNDKRFWFADWMVEEVNNGE